MRQKRQKTASFFNKTRESETTKCLEWKQQSQDINWHKSYVEWTFTSND